MKTFEKAKGKTKTIIDLIYKYLGNNSVYSRQLCAYLIRKHTELTYAQISEILEYGNNRYGSRKDAIMIFGRIKTSKVVESDVRGIEKSFPFYD